MDEKKEKTENVSGLIFEMLNINKIDDMAAIAGLSATMLVIFANRLTPLDMVESTMDLMKKSYPHLVQTLLDLKKLETQDAKNEPTANI